MSNGGISPSTGTATVAGTAPAKVKAYPPEYWNDASLNLYYNSKTDCSIDGAGAKKYKKKATAPLNYVKDLQTDLITLGYLKSGNDDGYYGPIAKRAVTRFQRHAKRVYRLAAKPPLKDLVLDDISPSETFTGLVNGVCDQATAKEVRKWIDKPWSIPVGRFKLKTLSEGGKLREDAADEWEKIVKAVASKGGTLGGPYGDTTRPLRLTSKTGTSKYSFHYCGRAVDINQGYTLNDGKGTSGTIRRYWVCKDPSGTDMYWIIYCKTDKQDGTQGTQIKKNNTKYYSFGEGKERYIPEAYYIDLTAEIQSTGKFEHIPAQSNWASNYDKTEWWHFQYKIDKQKTFQDELELIGFTEADIQSKGWNTDAMLDHVPG